MKTSSWLIASILVLAGCTVTPLASAVSPAGVSARALEPARFYAQASLQSSRPEAFCLQPASRPFLEAIATSAPAERDALVAAIRTEPGLAEGIAHFPSLSWEERLPLLRRVMALEARVMGFQAPPLVLEAGESRPAYFDFDPDRGGTGRVLLYPDALKQEPNPYAALLLLVHETRHSGQFQLAFSSARAESALARGYAAGFRAQRELKGFSFCDFCSLNHEYEAFQTGNYVVGKLTGWKVDTLDMGCFSSQFDEKGHLRIDLVALSKGLGGKSLLEAFNQEEKAQFQQLDR